MVPIAGGAHKAGDLVRLGPWRLQGLAAEHPALEPLFRDCSHWRDTWLRRQEAAEAGWPACDAIAR